MRPLSLKMTAFGPFPGTEVIDFSALGENPLFLINGPTGSGKTTILDAICFSLYGKTTGDERDGAQMRCDLASAEQLCEVSFEFELNGQKFQIRRVPEQQRPKARGDGFTEQKPEAQLVELLTDGTEKLLVASKVTEATREIENMTGMSVDQFRQVMILPQGKFRQLLLAESAEREKIFSTLFQTRIYKQLENRLKEQSASIRREREKYQQRQLGILDGAEVESIAELETEIKELQPRVTAALEQKQSKETALFALSKRLEQEKILLVNFGQLASVETELQQLSLQYEQIEVERNRFTNALQAQQIRPGFNQKQYCAGEIEQTREKIVEAVSTQEKAEGKLQLAEQSLKNSETINQEIDEQKKLQEQLTIYQKLHLRQDNLLNDHKSLQQKNEIYQQLQLMYETEQRLRVLKKLEFHNKQQLETQKHLENAEKFGTELAQVYEKQSDETKSLELAWHQGQATILAAELEVKQPCPVCGSIEHPHPAERDATIPDFKTLESSRKQLLVTAENLNTARDQFRELRGELKVKKTQYDDLLQQFPEAAGDKIDVVQDEMNKIQLDLRKFTGAEVAAGKLLSKDQLKEELGEAQQNLTALNTEIDLINKDLPEQFRTARALELVGEEVKAKIKHLEQQRDALTSARQTAHGAVEAATARQKELNKGLNELNQQLIVVTQTFSTALKASLFENEQHFEQALLEETDFYALKKRLDEFDLKKQKLIGVQEQLQTKLQGEDQPDLAPLEEQLQQLEGEKTAAATVWKDLDNRRQVLESTHNKVLETGRQLEELDSRYAVIGTLSDVANGQTGQKISLQRFVLSVLLDEVLLEASQRFTLMSKGRYQLLRNEDRSKGNKASGLDLLVDDAYTGKVRPVATLSGGESFMAALSLALGLSDVVQSHAGGIHLDTLFIDEGFGSLDPESLDLAIRTLVDLQSSGRMIGVISHVADLKEQIPLRIDVFSDRLGSSTKLSL
ncbi:MAG: SMC family ATPase [Desulfuromusa sp.]|nr:SMC family ATPase [Desulfuromusa sp.]